MNQGVTFKIFISVILINLLFLPTTQSFSFKDYCSKKTILGVVCAVSPLILFIFFLRNKKKSYKHKPKERENNKKSGKVIIKSITKDVYIDTKRQAGEPKKFSISNDNLTVENRGDCKGCKRGSKEDWCEVASIGTPERLYSHIRSLPEVTIDDLFLTQDIPDLRKRILERVLQNHVNVTNSLFSSLSLGITVLQIMYFAQHDCRFRLDHQKYKRKWSLEQGSDHVAIDFNDKRRLVKNKMPGYSIFISKENNDIEEENKTSSCIAYTKGSSTFSGHYYKEGRLPSGAQTIEYVRLSKKYLSSLKPIFHIKSTFNHELGHILLRHHLVGDAIFYDNPEIDKNLEQFHRYKKDKEYMSDLYIGFFDHVSAKENYCAAVYDILHSVNINSQYDPYYLSNMSRLVLHTDTLLLHFYQNNEYDLKNTLNDCHTIVSKAVIERKNALQDQLSSFNLDCEESLQKKIGDIAKTYYRQSKDKYSFSVGDLDNSGDTIERFVAHIGGKNCVEEFIQLYERSI